MAKPQVINTLKRKKHEIERTIAGYEKRIKAARRDLSHINAAIRLFEVGDTPNQFPVYVDLHRVFKRGEIMALCKEALKEHGPMTTRELALHVIKAKQLDEADSVLKSSVAYKIVMAMRQHWKRGIVQRMGKRQGAIVWNLPQDAKRNLDTE